MIFSRKLLQVSKIVFIFAARLKNVIEKMTSRRLRVVVYATPKGGIHTKPGVLHSGLSVCNSANAPAGSSASH